TGGSSGGPGGTTGGSDHPTDSDTRTVLAGAGATSGGGNLRHANAPTDFVGTLVRSVADGIGPTVKPAAVVAVATTFGFPLFLMLAVLLFLLVQWRFDGRDPKLRSAPLTQAETLLPWVDEERA